MDYVISIETKQLGCEKLKEWIQDIYGQRFYVEIGNQSIRSFKSLFYFVHALK